MYLLTSTQLLPAHVAHAIEDTLSAILTWRVLYLWYVRPQQTAVIKVNPKNRHETQLIELDEGTSLGSMVYSQGKLHLVS